MASLFNKQNFISARFVNDRKTDIEVLFQGLNGPVACHVEIDTSQEGFKDLLKIVTIEQIQQTTTQFIEDQRKAVIEFHKKLIKADSSLTFTPAKQSTSVADLIFNFDPVAHKENLVAFKLEALDQPKLTAKTKKAIKEATSIAEIVKLF